MSITVLDISAKSLRKSKDSVRERADKVHWIVSDINDFKPVPLMTFGDRLHLLF
jgi:hypothetical protein